MDLSKRADSRIYWQYRSSDKLRAWVDTLPAVAQGEIEDPALLVADILNIDEQSGEQLDIIGRIVGLDRPPIVTVANAAITAFAADDDAPQMGESGEQFSFTKYNISSDASDRLFRVLIKARVEINNGAATINNVIRALRFITDADVITVTDNQDMTFEVSFGSALTSTVRFALNNFDVIPRPQGVEFLGYIESPTLTQFGAEFAQFGAESAQFNEVFT